MSYNYKPSEFDAPLTYREHRIVANNYLQRAREALHRGIRAKARGRSDVLCAAEHSYRIFKSKAREHRVLAEVTRIEG